jgi:DNA-binding NarL/FixJ family response regulator
MQPAAQSQRFFRNFTEAERRVFVQQRRERLNAHNIMHMTPEQGTPTTIGPNGERLTPTQIRVIQGVHSGLANKQIAFDLGIAEATVKAHMTALMRKLNVRNRTQVALLAEKMDLAQTA